MEFFKSLLTSEHGVFAALLILAATILTIAGHMTTDQWITYSQWIFGIFTGGHAVVTAANSLASRPAPSTSTTTNNVIAPEAKP